MVESFWKVLAVSIFFLVLTLECFKMAQAILERSAALATWRKPSIRQDGSGSAWLPQPQRHCCHLLLDHLHLHGGCNRVLPHGVHCRVWTLEDIHERRCLGNPCRGSALLAELKHTFNVFNGLAVHVLVPGPMELAGALSRSIPSTIGN